MPWSAREARCRGAQKRLAQSGKLRLVSPEGLVEIGLGARPDGQPERHLGRRRVRSSTSSQGAPPAGSASASASRRSRSARCSSVRGKGSRSHSGSNAVPELLHELQPLGKRQLAKLVSESGLRHVEQGAAGPDERQAQRRLPAPGRQVLGNALDGARTTRMQRFGSETVDGSADRRRFWCAGGAEKSVALKAGRDAEPGAQGAPGGHPSDP